MTPDRLTEIVKRWEAARDYRYGHNVTAFFKVVPELIEAVTGKATVIPDQPELFTTETEMRQ